MPTGGVQGLVADELQQDFGADGVGEMVEQAAPLGELGHFALSVHSVGQSNASRLYCCQASLCSLITATVIDGGRTIKIVQRHCCSVARLSAHLSALRSPGLAIFSRPAARLQFASFSTHREQVHNDDQPCLPRLHHLVRRRPCISLPTRLPRAGDPRSCPICLRRCQLGPLRPHHDCRVGRRRGRPDLRRRGAVRGRQPPRFLPPSRFQTQQQQTVISRTAQRCTQCDSIRLRRGTTISHHITVRK